MTRHRTGSALSIVLSLFCLILPAAAIATAPDTQTAAVDSLWRNLAPKLYIQDETWSDLDYIKSEITFVNYVRDRTEADIQLIITYQTTGDGGKEYCLTFQGLGSYQDISLVLKHTTAPDATNEDIRKTLVDTIKRGLVPYVSRTKLRDRLTSNLLHPAHRPQFLTLGGIGSSRLPCMVMRTV